MRRTPWVLPTLLLLGLSCTNAGAANEADSSTSSQSEEAGEATQAESGGSESSDAETATDTSSGDGDGDSGSESGDGDGDGDGEPPAPSCDGHPDASDQLGSTPGQSSAPFPTFEHASLLWELDGDTNLNATVSVRVRETNGPWRRGLALRRTPADAREGFSWPNRFGGSLFGLTPDTDFEVELFMLDPDGGCEVRTLNLKTRARPAPAAGAPTVMASPANLASVLNAAQPGDIVQLSPGDYPETQVSIDGTENQPIVLRGQAGVVFNGDLRLDGRSDIIVDGVEVHGQIKFNAGTRISVINSRVITTADGIAMLTRGEQIYVANNVVTGATAWNEAALGVDGNNIGEGIVLTGPGHVIEHNEVRGFRDAISLLEDGGAVDQFSIDILYNDIGEAADDGIEADFCFHNCRISHNRLTNTFIALSSQPGLGGPTYFDHNLMYNVILSAFKLQRSSVGDLVWHNTVVKDGDGLGIYTSDEFSRQDFRNNLILGHGSGGTYGGWSTGSGDVLNLGSAADSVVLDYDAFGNSDGSFGGRIGATSFDGLAELQASGHEANAIEVSFADFAATVSGPDDPMQTYAPVDLRPAAGSAVVDSGVVIEGFNDGVSGGFAGEGPDRGALEATAELPDYGPLP